MKLFEDVAPVQIKCPCGISTTAPMSSKQVWRLLNKSCDTMFLNAKCKHNFFLSQAIIFDREGIQKKSLDSMPKRTGVLCEKI